MRHHPGRRVVLVQPAYLRLVGSHNDRLPLELCYLGSYLQRAGGEPVIVNADATGASAYIPWRALFDNFPHLMRAADGDCPVYSETVERIMSHDPEVVVISAADSVTPWVDSGNAYISAHLSRHLRALGVFTIGVGPFYTEVPDRFTDDFDALLIGGPSPTIVDIVEARRPGIHRGAPHDLTVPPLLDVEPECRDDVAMTAFGCPHRCAFCLARTQPYRSIPVDAVVADLSSRTAHLIDLGDAIPPMNPSRLRELVSALRPLAKTYTCEISVASATPDRLAALVDLGVVSVKLGLESAEADHLALMGKRQNQSTIVEAADRIRNAGLRLTGYVLLGGPAAPPHAAEVTYELCQRLRADDYVINVWAHHDLAARDFRYDGHFSSHLVDLWGLSEWMPRFFHLQDHARKFGLGRLVGPRETVTCHG